MIDKREGGEMKVEHIAMICHEANRAYCITIGDNSQPRWEDAPDWQRDSAIKGVEFRVNNPSASAASMHQSWLQEKHRDGWKYGAVKSAVEKKHPRFVSYSDLPAPQQKKDALFSAVFDAVTGVSEAWAAEADAALIEEYNAVRVAHAVAHSMYSMWLLGEEEAREGDR